MTCTRREAALALYVEGDLPEGEVPALEEHLAACEGCRSFLADLRESQAVVHELAAEPLAEASLLAVRSAFRRRLSTERKPRPWRWAAVAAVLTALIAGGYSLWRRTPAAPIGAVARSAAARPSAAPVAPAPRPEVAEVPPRAPSPEGPETRSTLRTARTVSPDVAHPTTAPTLSQEDADQLARAVVAVSRIERVTDADREEAAPSTWVRLTTDDPKVVIYWQLESNGGT